ncbi:MAG: S-layer homology domain-containing protein, partial [Veillonella sp.]|nr:S-layer homology domain-containing protein [Veillonella sp.]
MQQVSTHTLRALILSALLTTSGMACAATPAQTPSANPAQHTVTTTATVQDTIATAQDKTAVPANTVVNQQLRSGVVTSPKDIQDVRPYIFSDVPIDFWASKSISAVAKAKLMKGYADGTFRPNQPMTREEVASLFNNITDD